ncbi:LysR family transcriptional regulator [Novosphingobium mangrovi (ex Huang et al. 2023)]|uniref:LysR family transcriptional regulator n=1 Tax=Novosphingobium mangrovi (ex Huang et al. 2023) TaxID=2976432 RepID=A0ABT2I1W9_9SPHN|nr:LysR family transcriptional regulator [Novosphingobium mangrovi (ex Huang et al. 2023)]MCT2398793.1 LysR family transcriptional regulator [Novosphingobium mangrovi (ex Huang et al. 2023)]
MMLSRFCIYFDEVAKRGSIRRASEHLNITPSAIDRQILMMEEKLGVPLFDRMPKGLRLTAAGEVLVSTIRRWRRDLRNVEAHIDELRGLRRGEVTLALVDGSGEFVTRCLETFSRSYPGIVFHMQLTVSQGVVDRVLSGEADIGLAFNPPERHDVRVERALVYQIGAVMPADHPLAGRNEVTLSECAQHPLVGPDQGNVLRMILDNVWSQTLGELPRFAASASSVTLIKSLVMHRLGIGFLTAIDVATEVASGQLRFVPLTDVKMPLSALSLISAAGRPQSAATSLLIQQLASAMLDENVPHIG